LRAVVAALCNSVPPCAPQG